jgi:hypothetical protein
LNLVFGFAAKKLGIKKKGKKPYIDTGSAAKSQNLVAESQPLGKTISAHYQILNIFLCG